MAHRLSIACRGRRQYTCPLGSAAVSPILPQSSSSANVSKCFCYPYPNVLMFGYQPMMLDWWISGRVASSTTACTSRSSRGRWRSRQISSSPRTSQLVTLPRSPPARRLSTTCPRGRAGRSSARCLSRIRRCGRSSMRSSSIHGCRVSRFAISSRILGTSTRSWPTGGTKRCMPCDRRLIVVGGQGLLPRGLFVGCPATPRTASLWTHAGGVATVAPLLRCLLVTNYLTVSLRLVSVSVFIVFRFLVLSTRPL